MIALHSRCGPVLMADDDADDRRLVVDAFRSAKVANPLRFVGDGEALLDYLRRAASHDDDEGYPLPALILLDLNMPRMDGRETLHAIKADPDLGEIPVVVLTTSRAEDDARRARKAGCDAYLIKPDSFGELVELIGTIGRRWLGAGPGGEGTPS